MTNSLKVMDLERLPLASASKEWMEQGWFYGSRTDYIASILSRSGRFPTDKLTFYSRGEDNCAVVFGCHESS